MSTASSQRTLKCVVVTPERTVVDAAVDFVALPMYDGELGVAPGRAPLIGRLGPGELRTKQGGDVKRFYVDGGFAQVRSNVVTVLTPRALPAAEIKTQAAEQVLAAPATPTTTPEARTKAQDRARVQLRIGRRERGESAAH